MVRYGAIVIGDWCDLRNAMISLCAVIRKRRELALWHRAKLSTTSCTREDMSRRPRAASCTPVDKECFLPCPESDAPKESANWWATSSIDSKPYDTVPMCSFFISISAYCQYLIRPINMAYSPFCVRVPVLSLRRYSMRPSSSGRVLVRTIVSGISGSDIICEA